MTGETFSSEHRARVVLGLIFSSLLSTGTVYLPCSLLSHPLQPPLRESTYSMGNFPLHVWMVYLSRASVS